MSTAYEDIWCMLSCYVRRCGCRVVNTLDLPWLPLSGFSDSLIFIIRHTHTLLYDKPTWHWQR